MRGLGDNLYQRACMHGLAGREVWIDTPWPELYTDLPVRCLKPVTNLRTQRKNAARQPTGTWHPAPPASVPRVRLGYGRNLVASNIAGLLSHHLGTDPLFDLPPTRVLHDLPEKFALIRPVTIRTEWRNEARNPQPEYLAQAASALRQRGYTVISVADLAAGEEWALEPLPEADVRLHAGEADVMDLLALVRAAKVCVGGVGWLLPACIGAGTPLYVAQGGQGGHNAPDRLLHPAMDTSRIGWATPQNYCRCTDMRHACNKHIKDFEHGFSRWLDDRGL